MDLDLIYIRCDTLTWLYNRSNDSIERADLVDFKVYITRLEKELNELYDKLLELINSSLFNQLESNIQEEMWLMFNDIGKELEYP